MEQSNKISKVLVTGGTGQLGNELKKNKNNSNFDFFFPTSDDFNLGNLETIKKCLDQEEYNLILNLAAYTNVDKSESDQGKAKLVNERGVELLAEETYKRKLGLIHASTDYVFGGIDNGPYYYNSEKSPINYYGLTKSNGEDLALKNNNNCLIIRFASLFSEYGNNFVKTMVKAILNNNDLRVVSDQKISMSYAGDFSKNINYLIELFSKNNIPNILHFANKGHTDWFSVTKVIYDEIKTLSDQDIKCELIPIALSEWSSEAERPLDSRLHIDYELLEENQIYLKSWEEAVRLVVKKVFPKILKERDNE